MRRAEGALGGGAPRCDDEEDRGFAPLDIERYASELCARGTTGLESGVDSYLLDGVAGELGPGVLRLKELGVGILDDAECGVVGL